jgi:hypothetical protein
MLVVPDLPVKQMNAPQRSFIISLTKPVCHPSPSKPAATSSFRRRWRRSRRVPTSRLAQRSPALLSSELLSICIQVSEKKQLFVNIDAHTFSVSWVVRKQHTSTWTWNNSKAGVASSSWRIPSASQFTGTFAMNSLLSWLNSLRTTNVSIHICIHEIDNDSCMAMQCWYKLVSTRWLLTWGPLNCRTRWYGSITGERVGEGAPGPCGGEDFKKQKKNPLRSSCLRVISRVLPKGPLAVMYSLTTIPCLSPNETRFVWAKKDASYEDRSSLWRSGLAARRLGS